MKIDVRDAKVSTAAVEIQTLVISGRQVTLAVFRQLLDEEPFDESGTLRGIPWGTVNYHPDPRCKSERSRHLHLVWQFGGELRRAWVPESVKFDGSADLDAEIEEVSKDLDVYLSDGYRSDVVKLGGLYVLAERRTNYDYRTFLSSDSFFEKVRRERPAAWNAIVALHDRDLARLESRQAKVKEFSSLPQLFIAI